MTPWPVDQSIPKLCTIPDVCRILQMSRATFYALEHNGELGLIEAAKVGKRRRFTGTSVARRASGIWEQHERRTA